MSIDERTIRTLLALVPPDGVLGLGEPTHGSANAFSWKLDVICALAERGLLAALALEDSWIVGTRVDSALAGEAAVYEAWADMASLWRTRTIITGIRRLQRISSARAGGPVRFIGVDSKRADLAARALWEAGIDIPGMQALASRMDVTADVAATMAEQLAPVARESDGWLAGCARQVVRHIDAHLLEPDLGGLPRRDTHMAATLLENRPDRDITVLWAHNEHVAKNPDFFGWPSTGHVLAAELGDAYAAVGMFCGPGACRAVDPSTGEDSYRAVPLPDAPPNSTDALLVERGPGLLRGDEFSHPGPRRFLGWRIDTSLIGTEAQSTFAVHRPSSDFDAFVVLDGSSADIEWSPEAGCLPAANASGELCGSVGAPLPGMGR